jgi:hypothetical protein
MKTSNLASDANVPSMKTGQNIPAFHKAHDNVTLCGLSELATASLGFHDAQSLTLVY